MFEIHQMKSEKRVVQNNSALIKTRSSFVMNATITGFRLHFQRSKQPGGERFSWRADGCLSVYFI